MSYFSIPWMGRADRRIIKSLPFLDDFYKNVYPRRMLTVGGVAVASILVNIWLIFLR
jgi:hypothetical protein